MKFGLHLGNYGTGHDGSRLVGLATLAEEHGYDSVWVSDHVVSPAAIETGVPQSARGRTFTTDVAETCYEAIVLLSHVAGVTDRVRLGTSVLVPAQRHAVVLAKQIATLDALSGGRVDLGVGGGWLAEEYAALQAPFESRWARLEETLDVFRALWTEHEVGHRGPAYSFAPVRMAPKPVTRGGPRVTIGGRSTRALRIAGERGSGLNAARLTPEECAASLARVRRYAEAAGRDPSEMTVLLRCDLATDGTERPDPEQPWRLAGSAEAVATILHEYAAHGVTEVLVTATAGETSAQDDRLRWLGGAVASLTR